MKLYMWRDRFDGDMIQLGTDTKKGFTCWGQMHIDGVAETFGAEVKAELGRRTLLSVHAGQEYHPICVESEHLTVNLEPIRTCDKT